MFVRGWTEGNIDRTIEGGRTKVSMLFEGDKASCLWIRIILLITDRTERVSLTLRAVLALVDGVDKTSSSRTVCIARFHF